ncbi:dual OB domain-containing protein [Armatimonas sp.]|uniref:dual OB domain-containing protein n=1 Tax=Armatimonas sp. TaxID=1872638 RepID=UPI00375366FF
MEEDIVVKQIICLANSRKLNGRCIAGKEIINSKPAGWIRPVGANDHEGVSEEERQYQDGSDPRVLDIINLPLREPQPKLYQQENWLLAPGTWAKVGQAKWEDLKNLTDSPSYLWFNNNDHSSNGIHDRIILSHAQTLDTSLKLIYIDGIKLRVCDPGAEYGNSKRRVKGRFKYNSVYYSFWVTDPICTRKYLKEPNGDYLLGESFLTVSLGEPHTDGYCYKLIAAVISREEEIL